MQLSLHADYALRVLIYAGTHADRLVTTQEISNAYGISKNHLVRVVQTLAQTKYLRVQAGRFGGLSLAADPEQIRLGDVIRHAEPNLRLVECFDRETNTCPIARDCVLRGMLHEALLAFLASLNRYTLADVLKAPHRDQLRSTFAEFVGVTLP
jgi:Rrf2 family transcriptional regulator, nitric oxide-sensitive transcriptional repressor